MNISSLNFIPVNHISFTYMNISIPLIPMPTVGKRTNERMEEEEEDKKKGKTVLVLFFLLLYVHEPLP